MDWLQWARLVRIPTVFTILADVSAAFLLVGHGPQPLGRMMLIVLAGLSLYWAGMIFNGVFDLEQDRRERPQRPLPSGAIAVQAARRAGTGLMVVGVLLAASAGYLPASGYASSWLPAAVAVVLAAMILLYDGPLKATVAGPVAMGACRMLSFLLGAAPLINTGQGLPPQLFPMHVWLAALGFGVYVMGVTLMARHEAGVSPTGTLASAILVMAVGCALLAAVPQAAAEDVDFRFRGDQGFALLIGLLGFTVVVRAIRMVSNPTGERVQMTVRVALLTLIPLYAAFAMLGAGPIAGLGIFALIIPALIASARFPMT